MPQNRVNLQELLAYENSHAPWFALNEHLPHALLRRNLKLLRGLNGSSKITLEELDRLTEKEIKDAVSVYQAQPKQSTHTTVPLTTAPQFFQSIIAKSPYFSEIIPYSSIKNTPMNPKSTPLSASTHTNPEIVPQKNTAPVHGFHLNEGEAFSSTRYFSKDKKSHAQIIAKDGVFYAKQQNLNHEQKTDLVFEMSFQFLLNLPPERKTITLDGSPEMVHRMRAAFLYLQKEAGTRYADITFQLPDGMSIAPEELNDAYIKKHLGELNETPQQIVQWRHFLKMETNSPVNVRATTLASNLKEQKSALIDMERIFHTPDLSQQDKILLNEYQCYLNDTWVDGLKECQGRTESLIAEHEEFMRRTEKALQLFKKAPSLEREFEALKMLYIKTMESHHETLESLHQNELAYEEKMKELMPQLLKARRHALESGVHSISEHLKVEMKRHTNLSKELKTSLLSHAQNMHEIKHFIKDKEELSDEMMRSCGAQMLHAVNCLEGLSDYSKSPLFQQIKEYSKEQSEIKEKVIKTAPEQLRQASNQVKERLHQFKKELQEPKVSEVLLDTNTKEQFRVLTKNAMRIIEGIDVKENQLPIEQLITVLQRLSSSSDASTVRIKELHQRIDAALPHVHDNPEFVQVLSQMKAQIIAPAVLDALSQEPNTAPLQAMR